MFPTCTVQLPPRRQAEAVTDYSSTAEAVGRLAPLIYTVSLKLLYFSVVITAPANCVEQRAQSCV